MNKVQNASLVVTRILMPILFIVAGWGKMHAYSATAAYMASAGVPSFFLPLTILLEFGGVWRFCLASLPVPPRLLRLSSRF